MDCYAFTTRFGELSNRIITEAKVVYNGEIFHSEFSSIDTKKFTASWHDNF